MKKRIARVGDLADLLDHLNLEGGGETIADLLDGQPEDAEVWLVDGKIHIEHHNIQGGEQTPRPGLTHQVK